MDFRSPWINKPLSTIQYFSNDNRKVVQSVGVNRIIVHVQNGIWALARKMTSLRFSENIFVLL